MTEPQGAALLDKMDALTKQVHDSAQYNAGVIGWLLAVMIAVLCALLVVQASRPFWRH